MGEGPSYHEPERRALLGTKRGTFHRPSNARRSGALPRRRYAFSTGCGSSHHPFDKESIFVRVVTRVLIAGGGRTIRTLAGGAARNFEMKRPIRRILRQRRTRVLGRRGGAWVCVGRHW